MLTEAILETPRINTEVVDLYSNRLEFTADRHTIYLRVRGFGKNDWAIGLFRMTAQDVEDVIKGFDVEWTKALEDATSGIVPVDTTLLDPKDKGKGKIGFKRKDAEAPLAAQKKKKKVKFATPPAEATMTDDEYDLIASRLQEKM